MSSFLDFWYAHSPIMSVLIPAFTGFLLILLGNPGSGALKHDWRQPWRRGLSLASIVLGLATAIAYLLQANTGKYLFINWLNGPHHLVLSWCLIVYPH